MKNLRHQNVLWIKYLNMDCKWLHHFEPSMFLHKEWYLDLNNQMTCIHHSFHRHPDNMKPIDYCNCPTYLMHCIHLHLRNKIIYQKISFFWVLIYKIQGYVSTKLLITIFANSSSSWPSISSVMWIKIHISIVIYNTAFRKIVPWARPFIIGITIERLRIGHCIITFSGIGQVI